MNQLPSDKRAQLIHMLCEGASMRSVMRITDTSYNAVQKLLRDAGEAAQEWHDRAVRSIHAGHVEVDEVWSFTYAKQRAVAEGLKGSPAHAGHTWAWTALDGDSKLMISWSVAERNAAGAFALMRDLRARLRSIRQLTSDGLYAYESAVEDAFGADIDFGMLVKPNTADVQERSIPKPVQRSMQGNPDPDRINTSYVERSNLTLRMQNRRYTRLTNAFSKTLVNHCHMLALYFTFYNWCRPHLSLGKRVTPAMAAELCSSVYPVSWIVELVDIGAAKPQCPRFYNTKRRSAAEAARTASEC